MGVGVSLDGLAGAVAACGGMGDPLHRPLRFSGAGFRQASL
ncbi:MAG: hypothetical protein ACLU38_05965 [Dysosmobacter sp.]